MGDGLKGGGSWADRSCRALWQFSMLVELFFMLGLVAGVWAAIADLPRSLWEIDTYFTVGTLVLLGWFVWETFRARSVLRLRIYFGVALIAVGVSVFLISMVMSPTILAAVYLIRGIALMMVSVPFAVGFGMRIRMLRRREVRGFEVVGVR